VANPSVSIIISSYNYDRFLRQTIDSALKQTYPNVEVIVVDDGSSDDSPDIVKSYGESVIGILKENGGQASSLNRGFAASRGDILIFVDSDDFLFPHAAERIAAAFTQGVAKVQYLLRLVGEDGEHLALPSAPFGWGLRTENARDSLLRRGWYSVQPTSGNAFARWAIERISPIPERDFPTCPDVYLNVMTPFEGEVVCLSEILAAYRVHSSNHSNWMRDLKAVNMDFKYHLKFQRYLIDAASQHGYSPPKKLEFRNYLYVRSRLASLRFARESHPYPNDRSLSLALRGIYALWVWWDDINWRKRAAWSVWFLLTALMPNSLARTLMTWFYNPLTRPRALQTLGTIIR